jgi:hypothetical protein
MHDVLRASGRPLDRSTRDFMESRFGHDFSAVRVHTDDTAARSASALSARAYTIGRNVVFAAGEHQPSTQAGKHLLAHELAHVVQQQAGAEPQAPQFRLPHDPMHRRLIVGEANDPAEQEADQVADHVMQMPRHERVTDAAAQGMLSDGHVSSLLPKPSAIRACGGVTVQRQYRSSQAPTTNPNALIPITDFITYVEAVERHYAQDTPDEILTRIRSMYYSGLAFDQLIPASQRVHTPPGMYSEEAAGYALAPVSHDILDMARGQAPGAQNAFRHLTAHADENAIGDNPSPYIVMPDGSRIDVGHLLLGLESLLYPRVSTPYSDYGIPGIDPASWPADLALASFWTDYHRRNGHPAPDAPVHFASPDFEDYYRASTPNEDLLGDADSFGTHEQATAAGPSALSNVLRVYYLGERGNQAGVARRWRTFCARNHFSYVFLNGQLTWDAGIFGTWLPRLNRLCDLFASGAMSRLGSMAFGTSPSRGDWPQNRLALQHFLDWIRPRLEAELAAEHQSPSGQGPGAR